MQVEASNTLSILNKFRRGSDNIDLLGFEGRGEKEKGVLEMSQSMQASSNIGE